MKKILSIILMLVMLAGLVSCREKEPEPIDYQVYYASNIFLDGTEATPEVPEDLKAKSSSELQLTFSISSFELVREDAEKEKTLNIGEKEFVLEYKYTQTVKLGEKAKDSLGDFEYIDHYVLEGGNYRIYAEYYSKTGKLIYYSNDEAIGDYKNEKFTFEMAQERSKELFESIYGVGALEKYTVDVDFFDGVGEERQIKVDYRLNIHGVGADEFVRFVYTKNGFLVAFVANRYGQFEKLGNITAEAIENAEKALKGSFPDYFKFQDHKRLKVDKESGACVLEMAASNQNAKDKTSYMYYINVTSME